MIIMSVDLGKARTGIAVCDKTEFLASPYTVIFEKSPKQLLEKVSNTAKETKAELIVVGLPKNMDGSEGESAQNARAFAENLSNETIEKFSVKGGDAITLANAVESGTVTSEMTDAEEKSVKMSLTRLPPQ